ncbi:MAG TPA: ferritin-like domain-containing protein [Ilumatobacteraceae bacterium]|nr:ferritin-like domain-containing protein [Ilumatobacteraceae bacterium]
MTAAAPRTTFDRRTLLHAGGLTLSLGAIIAACGEDRAGGTEPGRVGEAPEVEPLPEGEVDDVVLLRTAQSLEHTALDAYTAARGLDVLSAAQDTIVQRFVDDHTGHSVALGGFITEAGGEEFACANPWVARRVITPIFDALDAGDGSDDLLRDVLNIAHALESLAAASYQALVGSLVEPDLRMKMMQIGADESRHAATLAMAITGTPAGYINPLLLGDPAPAEGSEFPVVYAVPSTFGTVSAVELIVGATNDDGQRFAINLQTPAANTFVYNELSC